jgi:hypothetical protein
MWLHHQPFADALSCLLTYIHTYIYIQKFIYARWPQQLRADCHEGRDFGKNIQINTTKLYINTKTNKEGITI